MIYRDEPMNWHDLQEKVARIFRECGCRAEVERNIDTVRGVVNIDVYVVDNLTTPSLIYLCECKHWTHPVPKTVVHAFRTVVQDAGAHVGYLVSQAGFQSGAVEAANNANVFLLDWFKFQSLVINRWKAQMYRAMSPLFDDLFEYYDYLSAPIGNAINGNQHRLREFEMLIRKYEAPSTANSYSNMLDPQFPPALPHAVKHEQDDGVIEEIIFEDYRTLFDYYEKRAKEGIEAFRSFVNKYRAA